MGPSVSRTDYEIRPQRQQENIYLVSHDRMKLAAFREVAHKMCRVHFDVLKSSSIAPWIPSALNARRNQSEGLTI
jgi:hypothetical protein